MKDLRPLIAAMSAFTNSYFIRVLVRWSPVVLPFDSTVVLEHADIDIKDIEAFLQKLHKTYRDCRQMQLKFDKD